jgi:hypothetical protein
MLKGIGTMKYMLPQALEAVLGSTLPFTVGITKEQS